MSNNFKNIIPLEDFNWDEFENSLPSDINKDEKANACDEVLNKISDNQVVEGVVISIDKKEVVVNIGDQIGGIISASEFRYNPELKIGDSVEVFVENMRDSRGQIVLSHKKARLAKSWERINDACENEEIVQGYIKCRTKGGMVVDVFGIEAFLPGSLIDIRPIHDYAVFVGKTMDFKVVKINKEFRNVVLSHKKIVEQELAKERDKKLDELKIGQVIDVVVSNITDYGAFVYLGCVTGLISIKELAWKFIKSPSDVVAIGEKIRVKVIDISDDKSKIWLSRKALLPQIENLKKGDVVSGKVVKKVDFGVIIDIGDFNALATFKDLSSVNYALDDTLECDVISNIIDDKKHRKIKVGNRSERQKFVNTHEVGAHVEGGYVPTESENTSFITVVCDGIKFDVPQKALIEPYLSKSQEGTLLPGEIMDFVFEKFSPESYKIKLSMIPIIRERELEEENWLKEQIERGSIVAAEVTKITKAGAQIHITDTNISTFISNEELSPNKVINAQDEVFVGEQIEVVYLGETDGRMKFSRRYLVSDKYDDKLYDMSLMELLATMDIHTNKFVGKLVSIKGNYFLVDLISVADEFSDDNGKLLVDPVNGKCLIAFVDNKLRKFFIEGSYYQVELDVANKAYRQKEGTPYQFHISSNNIKDVKNLITNL